MVKASDLQGIEAWEVVLGSSDRTSWVPRPHRVRGGALSGRESLSPVMASWLHKLAPTLERRRVCSEHRKMFDRWTEFIQRVEYKPGWIFAVAHNSQGWSHPYGCDVVLVVAFEAQNARQPDVILPGPIQSTSIVTIDPKKEERHAMDMLKHQITMVELHERDEWLFLDGKIHDDPHNPRRTS